MQLHKSTPFLRKRGASLPATHCYHQVVVLNQYQYDLQLDGGTGDLFRFYPQ
jgi:hypothetical protein